MTIPISYTVPAAYVFVFDTFIKKIYIPKIIQISNLGGKGCWAPIFYRGKIY